MLPSMTIQAHRRRGGWLRGSLPFWLLLPTVVLLLITQVYPGLYTIWLSLHTRRPDGWEYVRVQELYAPVEHGFVF